MNDLLAEDIGLPCGHSAGNSLFETVGPGATLIIVAAQDNGFNGEIPPAVWCAEGDGWVELTDEQQDGFFEAGLIQYAADE